MASFPRKTIVLQSQNVVKQFLASSQVQSLTPAVTTIPKCHYSSHISSRRLQQHHNSNLLNPKNVNSFNLLSGKRHASSTPRDKKLFTPGPLGVTLSVKEAMLRDVGSRDSEFIETVIFIRKKLLEIAGVDDGTWSCIPLQGSGTFAVDASYQTFLPREGGKALVIENGAYGKRMKKICEAAGIECHMQSFREDERVEPEVVADALSGRTKYDMVAIVHCETSSGVVNPVHEVGNLVHDLMPEAVFLVDAISAFGAIPLDLHKSHVDVYISSSNKCLQGVPGFAFVMARNSVLDQCEGNSLSLSLDLYDQVKQLDKTNQFRFTPATHSMMAFKKAILEFEAEGKIEGRAKRYAKNRDILKKGMAKLGFKELLEEGSAGYIISSFHYPKDPNFSFKEFYDRLNEKDMVIYPGKVLETDCFRIGSIGDLHSQDMENLLVAINEVCRDMNMKVPVQN